MPFGGMLRKILAGGRNSSPVARPDLSTNSLMNSVTQLLAVPPIQNGALPASMPEAGIYLFSEGNNHLYVGRSRSLRSRYLMHTVQKRPINQASFAFLLAREALIQLPEVQALGQVTRAQIICHPLFEPEFSAAKRRIRSMSFRFLGESDDNRQAMLEVLCADVLQAHYSSHRTS